LESFKWIYDGLILENSEDFRSFMNTLWGHCTLKVLKIRPHAWKLEQEIWGWFYENVHRFRRFQVLELEAITAEENLRRRLFQESIEKLQRIKDTTL